MTASAKRRRKELTDRLAPFRPEPLDASQRGSGLNATWKLVLNGKPAILKTYSSRRNPLKTLLVSMEHALTGRTPYSAAARQQTEQENLHSWKQAGFDVPALVEHRFDPPLPIPCLCMEFITGHPLSNRLSDPAVPLPKRQELLAAFAPDWARRHAAALTAGNPRLIHEHATFEHVLQAADRLVTFDLEVSFTSPARLGGRIAAEIAGYMRSLLRRLPAGEHASFMQTLVASYPDRGLLKEVSREYLHAPSPPRRLAHRLLRRRARASNHGRISKYDVAELLESILR
jgi:hypothetical protein